jgi:hypothetical protein
MAGAAQEKKKVSDGLRDDRAVSALITTCLASILGAENISMDQKDMRRKIKNFLSLKTSSGEMCYVL